MADDDFPQALRELMRDELASVAVCTFARVKHVERDDQRLAVELKGNPDYVDGNVPLVAPHAGGDGAGDVPGVTAGDEVLVVFSADDISTLVGDHGTMPDAPRDTTPQHVVALPFSAYTDTDEVPDHEPGERIIAHPNGTMIRLGGSDDLRLTHPDGMAVEMDSSPDPVDPEVEDETRETPTTTAGHLHVRHSSGVGVSVHEDGIAITPGDRDADYADEEGGTADSYGMQAFGEGKYTGGREQGVLSHRQHNHPWRVELAGDHHRPEEGHRHLVPDGNGGYAMTGPPLPMRELFRWFCANYSDLTNSGDSELQAAQSFYQNWVAWMESELPDDYSLDPGSTEDTGFEWPYPEPVPSPSERDSFRE